MCEYFYDIILASGNKKKRTYTQTCWELMVEARGKDENITRVLWLHRVNRGTGWIRRSWIEKRANRIIVPNQPFVYGSRELWGSFVVLIYNYKKVWPLTRYTYGQPYLWISSREPRVLRTRYSQPVVHVTLKYFFFISRHINLFNLLDHTLFLSIIKSQCKFSTYHFF